MLLRSMDSWLWTDALDDWLLFWLVSPVKVRVKRDEGLRFRGGDGMSSGWYTRSWKMVRARVEGSVIHEGGGTGGLIKSPADSKIVVFGGADEL